MTLENIRLGIVSVWWPPARGGTSVYALRLANALFDSGVDVSVITASHVMPDQEEMKFCFPVQRTGHWGGFVQIEEFFAKQHDSWCKNVRAWAKETDRTHLIFNNDYHGGLVAQLRNLGFHVGYLVHDYITKPLAQDLLNRHWRCGNWDEAFAALIADEQHGVTKHHLQMPSLREKWSFVISTTAIQSAMIGVGIGCPIVVLHPRIETEPPSSPLTPHVTVAAINPMPQKGAATLASTISGASRDWSFRVVVGGWGNAEVSFPPLIEHALAIHGRVHLEKYVSNMANFYASTQVYLCPSLYEGYGMAPVEALYVGTPVVATDLPMIREGVGDAARLVPYFSHAGQWIEAISDVLHARSDWVERVRLRRSFLQQREAGELTSLLAFLGNLA